MSDTENKKITIELPTGLYHALRSEAKRQGLDLPDFVRRKIDLKPSARSSLANLPLSQILSQTAPVEGEDRLDFFG
jgi:hypothetical protein